MRIAWTLSIIAATLSIVTAWFFPAQPFNGLAILALVLVWIAGTIVVTRGGEQ